jgi:hypothetical protein
MTLTVNSTTEELSVNSIDIPSTGEFVLTSGYSKEPQSLSFTRTFQNDRYTTIEITFPTDFKDRHANGVYYYSIDSNTIAYEKGYIKLITDPGGRMNEKPFNSGVETENRESVVYYRPQY